ncbi:hypothetical protein M407DRAFT_3202 [Tulasnella calospora MUT 4182]|uniref:Putative 5'-nucleotidase C-terminal domain-containing protein n=1 Tax=Tulasnella calospora MUT 4182 TaxID=1051891 RepID=A0A0C3QWX7_9AGAM|nr:hypothetical protein M407DRAFT_3202 [Tulasnella calospora MUT 4182]
MSGSNPNLPIPRQPKKLRPFKSAVMCLSRDRCRIHFERMIANIGDVVTFVEYLRDTGADVVFIDTGDQTHGGGLSDADKPEGAQALLLHTSLPYDVLSPGKFAMLEAHPEIKEKYLAANVFYKPPNEPGAQRRQLGSTHRTWYTGSGRKITAIGVAFENESKTREAGVYIERVESILTHKWFTEQVLTSNPDVFLLVGHMSLSAKERPKWRLIHQAIRSRYPDTPIFIFAGHTHERQCIMGINRENPIRSLGIESGRYLETIGWVGANLTAATEPLELSRIHLDASRDTLIGLTGADPSAFTQASDYVMRPFHELAGRFGLDQYIGCLKNGKAKPILTTSEETSLRTQPLDYPWDTKKYSENDPHHAYNLYRNVAFPDVVPHNASEPYVLLLNNGFIRGPLYNGSFTLNDKFVNLPYDSQAFWSTRIPKMVAKKVLDRLSKPDDAAQCIPAQSGKALLSEDSQRPIVQGRYMRGLAETDGKLGDNEEESCDALGVSPPLMQCWPDKYGITLSKGIDALKGCDYVDFVTLEFLKSRAEPVIEKLMKDTASVQCELPSPGKPLWQTYGRAFSGDVIKEWVQISNTWNQLLLALILITGLLSAISLKESGRLGRSSVNSPCQLNMM